MDTNKNVAINEFSGGMNSDLNYNVLKPNQYVYGENIRFTPTSLLSGSESASAKKGVIAPIQEGVLQQVNEVYPFSKILAIQQIDNICVIVARTSGTLFVCRITDGDPLTIDKIFSVSDVAHCDKISTVINKEVDGIIKLYIANGSDQIMTLNVNQEYDDYNSNLHSIDETVSNSYFPATRVQIVNKISGRLPVGQVQYTYRFYKKRGIKSKLAPLTNKIQIIDRAKGRELGNAEGTETTIGLQLRVPCDNDCKRIFDSVQIFKISYKQINTDADIELIYDGKLQNEDYVRFNDVGQTALATYTAEEFALLDGLDIVPQVIEQNQGYMFAANTIDNTQIKLSQRTFDARSYSANISGNVVLYHNTNTEYEIVNQGDVYQFRLADLESTTVDNEYTLNKYSDMNVEVPIADACRYDTNMYLGGVGKNVNWRFICAKIKLQDETSSIPEYTTMSDGYLYYLKYNENNNAIEEYQVPTASYSTQKISEYIESCDVFANEPISYDNIFTSSLLRSLRRDEVYRYGIILYDKNGSKTDVYWIADIRTPSVNEYAQASVGLSGSNALYANVIGIEFNVHDLPSNIIGYQIVRCSKDTQYRKNIMQCVVARPIRQQISENSWSPYYPHYMLTSNPYMITNGTTGGTENHHIYGLQINEENEFGGNTNNASYSWYNVFVSRTDDTIFQLYSPEITNRRVDSLQEISSADDIKLFGFYYDPNKSFSEDDKTLDGEQYIPFNKVDLGQFQGTTSNRIQNKDMLSTSITYYEYGALQDTVNVEIKQIQDVKNPLWEDAYSNVQLGETGDETIGVTSATKQYKTYLTPVGDKQYLNWVCNAMYDIKAFKEDVNENQPSQADGWAIVTKGDHEIQENSQLAQDFPTVSSGHSWYRVVYETGFVGPGPVCFVADVNFGTTDPHDIDYTITERIQVDNNGTITYEDNTQLQLGVLLASVQHKATQYSGLTNVEKQLDVYYGFGNFRKLTSWANEHKMTIFDGDVYILPFEIVQMFKTYDFNSRDTLQSSQFVYYVPIESRINTFFDYGNNYRNTMSKTLQLEPGEITGVITQSRPLSQYSTIFSDNSTSNDVYNAVSNDDSISKTTGRIYYSNPKLSNGQMDGWLDFSPLNYIDVDSRHGDITCLKSLKDVLYCWQERSFGKIQVNERSLVSDTNNNMIQLGQGGVMQRIDYIDTNHGMSPKQFVCNGINGRMYWIDDKNTSIMMSENATVINLSERANVQNILNQQFDNSDMNMRYDIQNDELLCKCLINGNQLVFNVKLNIATSIYTREYVDMATINNALCGIDKDFNIYKYSNIAAGDNAMHMASKVSFVVNESSSITKVFDNQEIVFADIDNTTKPFETNTTFEFNTNVSDSYTQCKIQPTFFEGNVRYVVPRIGCAEYGQRMRGKWMKETISNDGTITNSISHIITKFRQSF